MASSNATNAAATGQPSIFGGDRPEDVERSKQSYNFDSSKQQHTFSKLPSGPKEEAVELHKYIPLGCVNVEVSGPKPRNDTSPSLELDADDEDFKELTGSIGNCGYHLNPRQRPLHTHFDKLLAHRTIRVFCKLNGVKASAIICRVWLLPADCARGTISREIKGLHQALRYLIDRIETSRFMWTGVTTPAPKPFDRWASKEECSLFYLFNTLPSPQPRPEAVDDDFASNSMHELLDYGGPSSFRGLKTTLYPYQARSVASMIQRESSSELRLDPRLEHRTDMNGEPYYYNPRDAEFRCSPRYFESIRGGILAETMGLGKTVMCLAMILATKHHVPQIPPEHQQPPPTRPKVGSLTQMVTSTILRHSLQYKAAFKRHSEETGESTDHLTNLVSQSPDSGYVVKDRLRKTKRDSTMAEDRRLRMCSGTIIVVPKNLVNQWLLEIRKHIMEGPDGLNVLTLTASTDKVPDPAELQKYDVVLFSRNRFELEIRDGSDKEGVRAQPGIANACRCPYIGATRTRNCTCFRQELAYRSPLKYLHWLRIIIDEGHNFASSTSNAVLVAEALISVERRWLVSGTPAKDLISVDLDLDLMNSQDVSNGDLQIQRKAALENRKSFVFRDSTKAVSSLGLLVSNFLQLRPWSFHRGFWGDYVYCHEHHTNKTYSAFTRGLRNTLEGLVVKTRPEDVEKDISLPPLEHRVVYLEPSVYDKITANLFVLVLTSNAVTSERTGSDYLFDKNSQAPRNKLIANLRQSNFFWTGFSVKDVTSALEHGKKYLGKTNTSCTPEDRQLLLDCMKLGELPLNSENWNALSRSHEMGLFMANWPEESVRAWTLGDKADPKPLFGALPLIRAKWYIEGRLNEPDPMEGFDKAGVKANTQSFAEGDRERQGKNKKTDDGAIVKSGVPSSSVNDEIHLKRSPIKALKAGSKRKRSLDDSLTTEDNQTCPQPLQWPHSSLEVQAATPNPVAELPETSPLRSTSVVGTVSAKLSYLLDRILEYQAKEKILIFYDGDNTAFYLAQCLELFNIEHRIYAKNISNELRSQYIVAFAEDESIRVLLMDINCGALGLNVNAASRVFFINPCCRPSIEAQAIKRAHRIGQTKAVRVETLVLKGTVEEEMFERAKNMTRTEHAVAKELHDDKKISDIIQNARPLPISDEEIRRSPMARLRVPQQLFGRKGWKVESEVDTEPGDDGPTKRVKLLEEETHGEVVPPTLVAADTMLVEPTQLGGSPQQGAVESHIEPASPDPSLTQPHGAVHDVANRSGNEALAIEGFVETMASESSERDRGSLFGGQPVSQTIPSTSTPQKRNRKDNDSEPVEVDQSGVQAAVQDPESPAPPPTKMMKIGRENGTKPHLNNGSIFINMSTNSVRIGPRTGQNAPAKTKRFQFVPVPDPE
ncbi:hypothetical protein BDY21DRAFT_298762 [Lineolata rhizophorae]|uniref:Helicase C-terminal domain-containing protein n=1 Tax=Lineolata rhizophorae TaxID=578093 RepID=A0A6A6PA22_9PEZI|nr:hypothetical protein BDY21DRAFT_298762 [Lineolata rhizophorae]